MRATMMFLALVLIFVGLLAMNVSNCKDDDAPAKGSECLWFMLGFNIMIFGFMMLCSWA